MNDKRPIQSRTKDANRETGYGVHRWPEFLAFAKRLGIDLELPTTVITIRIPHDEIVTIIHEYLADDIDQQDTVSTFETTNVHNEEFTTHQVSNMRCGFQDGVGRCCLHEGHDGEHDILK